jgi:hypothetical protein
MMLIINGDDLLKIFMYIIIYLIIQEIISFFKKINENDFINI